MKNDERDSNQATLRMVNVLRMALGRRAMVFQIIEHAPNESAARSHLAEMLDVQESNRHAILHRQGSFWLGTWRGRLEETAESLRLILERDAPQP